MKTALWVTYVAATSSFHRFGVLFLSCPSAFHSSKKTKFRRNFEELRGTSRNFLKTSKNAFLLRFSFSLKISRNFEELRGSSRNFEELRGTSRNFEEPRKRPRKEKRRRLGLKLPDCTLKLHFGSEMVEKAARKDVGANWGFSDFLAQGEPPQAKNTKGRNWAPLWWWRS